MESSSSSSIKGNSQDDTSRKQKKLKSIRGPARINQSTLERYRQRVAEELEMLAAAGVHYEMESETSQLQDCLTNVVVLVEGPLSSLYEGGVYRLGMTLASDYPLRPPTIVLLTNTFHPMVSPSSWYFDSFSLYRDNTWTSGISLVDIVNRFIEILAFPDSFKTYYLNSEVASLFENDRQAFDVKAREYTSLYATRDPSSESAYVLK
jgi:ubiquitin-protein ligase